MNRLRFVETLCLENGATRNDLSMSPEVIKRAVRAVSEACS